MPYYAYIDLQDEVKSPNNTFDPSIIKGIAKKYRKVDKPIPNVMYDSEADTFREMTSDEITARNNELAELKLENDIQNLKSCRILELYDVMKTDEAMVAKFNEFENIKEFALEHNIVFEHPVVKAEIEKLGEETFYNLKKQIILNRSV